MMNINDKKKKITLVSGPCGSGKTYSLPSIMEKYRASWNNHNRWLVGSISLKLADEIEFILTNNGYKAIPIHSEAIQESDDINNHDPSVVRAIIEQMAQIDDSEEKDIVIIITHVSYDILKNDLRKGWQYACDESAGLDKIINMISDKAGPPSEYFEIADGGELKLTKKGVDSHATPNKEILEVRQYCMNKKRTNILIEDEERDNKIKWSILSVPSYEYFQDGDIILNAGKNTCQYISKYEKMLDLEHMNMNSRIKNKKVELYYFNDKVRNSRYFRDNRKNREYIKRVRSWMIENCEASLYYLNISDREDGFFDHFKTADWKSLNLNIRGSNQYKKYNSIILWGTNNSPTSIMNRKEIEYGISPDDQYRNEQCEIYHQMIMRTSLRDPSSDETVKIYMHDHHTAEIMKEILEDNYDFDIEMIFIRDFNNLAHGRHNSNIKISKAERRRCQTLIKKATEGRLDHLPKIAAKIIAYSKISKSHRGILDLDKKHIEKTGKKL